MGKGLVIKDADFSANALDKILNAFERKFFNISDFTTPTVITSANRIRYYKYLEAGTAFTIKMTANSSIGEVSCMLQGSESDCYAASTGTAIEVYSANINAANSPINGRLSQSGWLCISVGGGYSPLLTENDVATFESIFNILV